MFESMYGHDTLACDSAERPDRKGGELVLATQGLTARPSVTARSNTKMTCTKTVTHNDLPNPPSAQ